MSVTPRVTVNVGELNKMLATDPETRAVLMGVADAIAAKATSIAPVGPGVPDAGKPKVSKRNQTKRKFTKYGGYYKHHFRVRPFRNSFRVWNDDPFAHLVEFGSVHNRAYAPLRTAVRSLGLRFKENPKSTKGEDG